MEGGPGTGRKGPLNSPVQSGPTETGKLSPRIPLLKPGGGEARAPRSYHRSHPPQRAELPVLAELPVAGKAGV